MTNEEKCKVMVSKANQFLIELNQLMNKYGFSIETMISEKKEPLNQNERDMIKLFKEDGGILITTGEKRWSDNGALFDNHIIPGYVLELHFKETYEENKEE